MFIQLYQKVLLQRFLLNVYVQVYWLDIGGQEEVKLKLKQVVEWFFRYLEVFSRMGIILFWGIFMYGFLGCFKIMIVKVFVIESGLNFLVVKVESV